MSCFKKIGIIGAGCYGTAIAQCFSRRADNEIILFSNEGLVTEVINALHMNIKYLPGILLNNNIVCTDIFSQLKSCDIIFFAVPMMAVSSVCVQIKEHNIKVPIVLCSKGLDTDRGRLQSDLFEENLNNDYAIFSGPSFAHEIAQGLPAGVNIASKNIDLSKKISKSLSSEMFEIEVINDPIGLQIAGAFKNILAIGCGILSGLKLGNSAISKLIVNGLREMTELAVALGGKKETFSELGGLGDVILTCTSRQSRNILFGEYLAGGGTMGDWTGALAEGVFASKAIPVLKQKYDISLNVFDEIYRIIHEKKCISDFALCCTNYTLSRINMNANTDTNSKNM